MWSDMSLAEAPGLLKRMAPKAIIRICERENKFHFINRYLNEVENAWHELIQQKYGISPLEGQKPLAVFKGEYLYRLSLDEPDFKKKNTYLKQAAELGCFNALNDLTKQLPGYQDAEFYAKKAAEIHGAPGNIIYYVLCENALQQLANTSRKDLIENIAKTAAEQLYLAYVNYSKSQESWVNVYWPPLDIQKARSEKENYLRNFLSAKELSDIAQKCGINSLEINSIDENRNPMDLSYILNPC